MRPFPFYMRFLLSSTKKAYEKPGTPTTSLQIQSNYPNPIVAFIIIHAFYYSLSNLTRTSALKYYPVVPHEVFLLKQF
jgi:hypothetical protein